jgi:glycosyltransferase involved in cell wall biosynthesis
MLKAADALHDAGYTVRVVCTNHLLWAKAADADVRSKRLWPVTVVDYDRHTAPLTYLVSGLRFHAARRIARAIDPLHCPLGLAGRALERAYTELLRAVLAEPTDLIYGGTIGGLPVVAAAARMSGLPYAIDLEDFYTAQQDESASGALIHGLAERIQRLVLPGAAFLTAAGAAIAAAYEEEYAVQTVSVNNTFPLPEHPPEFKTDLAAGLKLYWFSQTVGPRRGIEDAVKAMGLADIPGELHIRGNPVPGYVSELVELAAKTAPRLRIVHHAPVPPDDMIRVAQSYDVGLALEQEHVVNRQICLTNKAFTYILAGLAVILTDTIGQRPLALDLGDAARTYSPGDIARLAQHLNAWATDKAMLNNCKRESWRAARRRWHWEHPLERGALLSEVERVLK